MDKTIDKAAEHVIAYAYPTSESAQRHGHGRSGCYTLVANDFELPMISYEQATRAATEMGTVPGRWSMDHPLNSFHR